MCRARKPKQHASPGMLSCGGAQTQAPGISRGVTDTELCVDTTCRQACSLEYDVTLVQDGHSTWDRELLSAPQIIAHHNALISYWFVTTKDEGDILFEVDLAAPS